MRRVVPALLCLQLAVAPAWPQAALLPNAKQTFLDANGNPLSNGKVFMYVPNTATAKSTWSDATQLNLNTNPITLDAAGRAVIFGQGSYSQKVTDANSVQQWNALTTAYGSSQPSGATGTDTAPVGTVMPFGGFSLPVNWQYAAGQAIDRVTFAELKTAITITNAAVTCTSGSKTLAGWPDTSQMRVGAPVEASCVPTGTLITSVTSGSAITINNAATGTATTTATVFPWGNGDGTTTFNVPDMRGQSPAGAEAMGGGAGAQTSRLQVSSTLTTINGNASATVGSSTGMTLGMQVINNPNVTPGTTLIGINGTSVVLSANATGTGAAVATRFSVISDPKAPGAFGGSVGVAQTQGNLPNVNFAVTGTGTVSDTRTWGAGSAPQGGGSAVTPASGASNVGATASNPVTVTGGSISVSALSASAASGGVGIPMSTVQPTLIVNYIVKVKSNSTGAGGVVSLGGMFGDIVCDATFQCANQTIGLATQANNTMLANISNSGAVQAFPTTNSQWLDATCGSTRGMVIYRGAAIWSCLAPPPNDAVVRSLTSLGFDPSWQPLTVASVSSVGLAMPAIFGVSGSPVTTAGTLTATLANQSANQVFAGPATGSPATPGFRVLAAADIPLIPNAGLVNSSTTVNGVTCTLGSTCAIAATAASMTVGTTTVLSGTTGRVLFDNVGTLGEYVISGTGNVAMTTNPVFTTPTLGAALFTSLAGGVIGPQSDSTTAVKVTKADLSTAILTINTVSTGGSFGFGPGSFASSRRVEVNGSLGASNTIDSTVGFTVNAVAPSGNYLRGNGANFVASAVQAADLPLAADTSGSPSATAGVVRCDGTTIKCATGVLSNIGGVSLAGNNTFTGNNFFGGSRPWCDVQAKGAVGDGVTDDHAAIQACITQLNVLTTGVVFFPPANGGAYCTFSTLTTASNSSIIFMGTGVNGSQLSSCHHDVTVLALQGDNAGIQHMQLLGNGASTADTLPASNPTLDLSNCVQCLINDVIILGGLYGIKCGVGCGDIVASNAFISQTYRAGFYIGCATGQCGGYLKRVKLDQEMPNPGSFGATTSFPNWSASASVSAGDIRFLSAGGSYYIRYTVGGTTGGSEPTAKPWFANITDGTATAQLFSLNPYYGFQCDGGCNQTFAEQLDVLSPAFTYGLAVTNNNGSAFDPTLLAVSNSNFQGYLGAVFLDKGNEFRSEMNLLGGCFITNCAVVFASSTWGTSGAGGIKSINDYVVNGSYGWNIQPTNNLNGVFTNGSYQGLNQTAFITNGSSFNFSNNICGPAGQLGGAINQCYAIGGSADYFVVTNNQTHGATNANSITATGTHTTTPGNLH